jgi:hypothetical protein
LLSDTTTGIRGIKRLHKDSLKVFNKHLDDIEKIKADVKHLNSRVQEVALRKDSTFFVANGYCGHKNCNVKYKFYKKEVI